MSADWLLPLDWLLLSSACTAHPATAAFAPPLQPLPQAQPDHATRFKVIVKRRPQEAVQAQDQQAGELER